MQRNPDLIRAILLAVDASPTARPTVPGATAEEVSYHVKLLRKAGWLEADTLTWEGYEFLEAFRSDVIWDRAKAAEVSDIWDDSSSVFRTMNVYEIDYTAVVA